MKTSTIIILIIVLGIALALLMPLAHMPTKQAPIEAGPVPSAAMSVRYACDGGKTINAEFYQGSSTPAAAGEPPMPGGSAHIVLSDGRELDLKQTISADGVRYSNGNPQIMQGEPGAETFVFWSKGNGALVLENNEEKSYTGCTSI